MIERRKKIPKGRKFWLTAWVFGIPFATCSVALFLGKMTDTTYVGFLQVTIPVCLGAFHAANVAQKVGIARAENPQLPAGPTTTVTASPAENLNVGVEPKP